MVTPRGGLGWQAGLAAVALLAVVSYLTAWPSPAPVRPLPAGLARLRSGVAMADALDKGLSTGELQDQYVLDGSAGPRLGWALETRTGLQVGIKPHSGWAGWFASTIHAAGPDVAWHSVVYPSALPIGTRGRGIAVFAVQTATTQRSGVINYVVVAAVSRSGSYRWLVGYAHGLVAGASTRVLWSSEWHRVAVGTVALPYEAVTVVTDGRHSLRVWLGSLEVYASTRLRLQIPSPFQAYLEVQSSAPAYRARFTNFWVTACAPLQVRGVGSGALVALGGAGGLRSEAVAGAGGTAVLGVPAPDLFGNATLTVLAHGRSRRFFGVPYAGGDVLSLR